MTVDESTVCYFGTRPKRLLVFPQIAIAVLLTTISSLTFGAWQIAAELYAVSN